MWNLQYNTNTKRHSSSLDKETREHQLGRDPEPGYRRPRQISKPGSKFSVYARRS